MNTDKEIHVSPIGENWEVENPAQTLAQAETKEEAIEAAKEVAAEQEGSKVVIHTSDGKVEREMALKSSPPSSVS